MNTLTKTDIYTAWNDGLISLPELYEFSKLTGYKPVFYGGDNCRTLGKLALYRR